MEREIVISFNWWTINGEAIHEKHYEALEEDAMDRIFEMVKNGYTSGELFTNVRFGKDIVEEEDENDGIEYRGWWSLTIKNN